MILEGEVVCEYCGAVLNNAKCEYCGITSNYVFFTMEKLNKIMMESMSIPTASCSGSIYSYNGKVVVLRRVTK